MAVDGCNNSRESWPRNANKLWIFRKCLVDSNDVITGFGVQLGGQPSLQLWFCRSWPQDLNFSWICTYYYEKTQTVLWSLKYKLCRGFSYACFALTTACLSAHGMPPNGSCSGFEGAQECGDNAVSVHINSLLSFLWGWLASWSQCIRNNTSLSWALVESMY